MRLPDRYIAVAINALIGVGWAFVVIGAVSAFLNDMNISIFYGLASAILWSLPGLFLIVVLEFILSGFARLEESRKQTELLQKLVELQTKSSSEEE